MLTDVPTARTESTVRMPQGGALAQKRGWRTGLKDFCYRIFYRLFFTAERLIGAFAIFLFMRPMALLDLARRWKQFPQFQKLRAVVPKSFWQGVSARAHYCKMVFDWHEFMGVSLLHGRMDSPYWRKRITVRGDLPFDNPEWQKRPMLIAVMHTGAYALTRSWARSHGIKLASYIGALPPILDHPRCRAYEAAADKRLGVDVPGYFRATGSLREVMRYLKPGHALGMALDGGNASPDSDRQETGDFPVFVKKSICRIASQVNALVYASSVKRVGFCRYEIRFHGPLPDALVQKEDPTEATHELLKMLWGNIRANPDDLTWSTLEAFPPTFEERQRVIDERPRTWP